MTKSKTPETKFADGHQAPIFTRPSRPAVERLPLAHAKTTILATPPTQRFDNAGSWPSNRRAPAYYMFAGVVRGVRRVRLATTLLPA
jgi:hypothetical protein